MSWGDYPNTSAGRYWHPEGIYCELAPPDHWRWPLVSYGRCLSSLDTLNAMMRVAHLELAAAKERGTPEELEKASLRYGGLELLRDVDNEEDPDE